MPKTKSRRLSESSDAGARAGVIAKRSGKKKRSLAEMNKRFSETEDFCIAAAEANGMKILGRKRL